MVRLTVQAVAREVGVSPATIRAWHRRGLFQVERDWRGARVFTVDDLRRLRQLAGVDRSRAQA